MKQKQIWHQQHPTDGGHTLWEVISCNGFWNEHVCARAHTHTHLSGFSKCDHGVSSAERDEWFWDFLWWLRPPAETPSHLLSLFHISPFTHTHRLAQSLHPSWIYWWNSVAIRNTGTILILCGGCNGKEKVSVPIVSCGNASLSFTGTNTHTQDKDHSLGKARDRNESSSAQTLSVGVHEGLDF